MSIDIDRELRDLASAVEAAPVDVSQRVVERLAAGEGRAPRRRRWWAGLGVLVVAVGTLVLPGPRAAIADWLHIGGVEIREADPSATSAPPRTDDDLGFGPEVSLERAAAALGRPPLLPAGMGRPDHVYLDASYPTYRWSRVYLSEFVSGSDQPWVIKKLVPRASNIESVLVNGGPGFWIEGPHEVAFGLETDRRVGDVLLWEQDGLTLRLEGPATKEAALELAGTIRS